MLHFAPGKDSISRADVKKALAKQANVLLSVHRQGLRRLPLSKLVLLTCHCKHARKVAIVRCQDDDNGGWE